jgi:pimeloyl-ACP methyl ester carboxylesterase
VTTTVHTTVWQPAPDLAITLREAGHGDPVLLLHGAAGPDSLDPLIEHLAATRRVLAPTHPGFAGTTRPQHLGSVTDLATVYLRLIDPVTPARTTVIGASFGGWIAAEMAVADTGRIDRLVLIDAIGPRILGHPLARPTPPPPAPPVAAPPAGTGTASRRGPSPQALSAMRGYGGDTLDDATLLERVRGVSVPALLLWGEHDPVVAPGYGRVYTSAFPRGEFRIIPGGGHLPMREAPEQTYAAIDAFLTAKGPGTP